MSGLGGMNRKTKQADRDENARASFDDLSHSIHRGLDLDLVRSGEFDQIRQIVMTQDRGPGWTI